MKTPILLASIWLMLLMNNTYSGEESLYDFLWLDPDKSVYVLQNKTHEKKGSFYFDLGYSNVTNSKFQSSKAASFQLGYYIWEEWGIEVLYHKYKNKNNDSFESVQRVNNIEPFVRRFQSMGGILGVWSPFYGKINTFNKIYYFDWSIAAGVGQISAENNARTVRNPNQLSTYDEEKITSAIIKTELKFHINKQIHLQMEYMENHYRAPGATLPAKEKWRKQGEFVIGVGYSF